MQENKDVYRSQKELRDRVEEFLKNSKLNESRGAFHSNNRSRAHNSTTLNTQASSIKDQKKLFNQNMKRLKIIECSSQNQLRNNSQIETQFSTF